MHQAHVLEPGDTMYVGMLLNSGEYVEVRVAHSPAGLMVTDSHGTRILEGVK